MKVPYYMLLLMSFCSTLAIAQIPENVLFKKDIVYTRIDNWEGKLDVYLPKGKTNSTLVVYIHGGGWVQGSKDAEYEKIKVFIENGYAVANIEYRLAKQAPAPAAIEDFHCAMAYLLKNAKNLGFNKKKVILMGGSAGGHLALLEGLQSYKPVYTGGCNTKNFVPAAIISKYGPTDLLTWEPAIKAGGASAAWLGERVSDTAFIQSLSPTAYLNGPKIPVLFIHGDEDKTVPISQSQKLFGLLKERGFPTELYVVKGGKHGNFGAIETPKMDKVMLAFLAKYAQ
ncbi:alpha/beta hydrolase fold domain-containing protein [Pedobacter sp. MW01-1-1]|uniref:alpha/beta hydrolase fold domain-containing protein n=1 Tax=Pedobacter sp. MW01-1-1 TaxID=3383027 RepID=UPI003FF0707E